MARFVDFTEVTVGGSKLTVAVRQDSDLKSLAGKSVQLLERARNALEKTDIVLSDDCPQAEKFVAQWAWYYFLTEKEKLATKDLLFLKQVYAMIRTGLQGDVTLKVGAIPSKGTGATMGRVPVGQIRQEVWFNRSNQTPVLLTTMARPLPRRKTYHNIVASLGDGTRSRMGAIHISPDGMDADDGLMTLLHEASHKYAGTIDYAIMTEVGNRPEGFDDKAQAIINADSFAWFAFRCAGCFS